VGGDGLHVDFGHAFGGAHLRAQPALERYHSNAPCATSRVFGYDGQLLIFDENFRRPGEFGNVDVAAIFHLDDFRRNKVYLAVAEPRSFKAMV